MERSEAVVGEHLESVSFPSGLSLLLICPVTFRIFLISWASVFQSAKGSIGQICSVITTGNSFCHFLLCTSCDDIFFNLEE